MALTPAEIDALDDYPASQMVKLWRHLIAELGSNPEATQQGPNGRGYTLRQLDEATRALQFWLAREAAEAAATSGAGVFEYGSLRDPV
jgi:hypothetical protein